MDEASIPCITVSCLLISINGPRHGLKGFFVTDVLCMVFIIVAPISFEPVSMFPLTASALVATGFVVSVFEFEDFNGLVPSLQLTTKMFRKMKIVIILDMKCKIP